MPQFLITVIHMFTVRYWWTNQEKFNVKGKLQSNLDYPDSLEPDEIVRIIEKYEY